MTRERIIKMIAGSMILISTLGAYFIHINWIWLAVFVGANLLQYSISQWCLLNSFLKSLGIKSALECAKEGNC